MSLQTKRRPPITAGPSAAKPWRKVAFVDHRQEPGGPLAFAPVDLVNANGMNRLKLAMSQAPRHEPLDRMVNGFPTGLEGAGRFPPGHAARPTGQESHHGGGHRPLALAPGNVFDAHTVLRAHHPSRRIEKMDHDAPQRYKQPAPLLQLVIAWTGLPAGRTLAANPLVGLNLYLDPQRTARTAQTDAA